MMKSAQIAEFGAPEVIQVREVEIPIPKAGQVLVEEKSGEQLNF